MSKLRIGLTGGIGSGKTTVAQLFEKQCIVCIDADIIARDIVTPNTPAYQKIVEHFSPTILLPDQTIDRGQLREIVFNQKQERLWLNNLLHPLIQESMLSQAKASQSVYTLLIVPLLIESHWNKLVDRTLVIDVTETTQKERASERDHSCIKNIEKIIATQISRKKRLDAADDIITNDGTIIELEKQVISLDNYYRQLAGEDEKTSF